MTSIHPTAVIAPSVSLGLDVKIGPFCIVEAGASIGSGCRLESHVVIKPDTTLGNNNFVGESVVLGGAPQHAKCPDRVGRLKVGDGNTFREFVTVHRALSVGSATKIGDGNLLMVNSHVGHDCDLGNRIIVANNVMLAGHVTVGDRAYLSGAVGVHQFCRIGSLCMVGGQARVTKDVPPFVTVDGHSTKVVGLNLVGLRRNGFGLDAIRELKAAYRAAFRSGLSWKDKLAQLSREFPSGPAQELASFMSATERGCISERATPKAAKLKIFHPVESGDPPGRGVA